MHRSHVLSPQKPPSPHIIDQAAAWLVKIENGALTAHEELQLQSWCIQSEEHELAWKAAMQLKNMMGNLPAELSRPVLGRHRLNKRQLLLSLSGVVIALPATWMTHNY